MYIGDEDDRFMVLGPAKTSIGKIKGMYRYRVIVKGGSYKKLTLVMKELYNRKDNNTSFKQVRLTMDLNPMSLM
jgi:primosomal protein N'